MEDLASVFGLLATPASDGDVFVARTIGGRERFRIAADIHRNPVLLVAPANDDEAGGDQLPLELQYLSFRPRCRCRVRSEGSESEETLAVLKCSADDVQLREYFLRTLSGMVEGLPLDPSERDLARIAHHVA